MASELLKEALELIIKAEGGDKLSLDDKDPGNYARGRLIGTKYGISAQSHPLLNIRDLTEEQAIEIYENEYAKPINFDKLVRGVGYCVLDAAVQNGPNEALRWYKECAPRSSSDREFIIRFCATRMAMEKNLKIWAKEHSGLEARIDATEKAALSMLGGTKVAFVALLFVALDKLFYTVPNTSTLIGEAEAAAQKELDSVLASLKGSLANAVAPIVSDLQTQLAAKEAEVAKLASASAAAVANQAKAAL
ncbi:unnamed protein product [Sphagnum tenellum]